MRRAIFVAILCLLYVSLHAQLFPDLITFNTLKDGVYDVAVIKKELIINGFTKITKDSESSLDVDNYAYGYDEDGETASIWVEVGTLIESEDGGFYVISIQTFGHYIHDELVEDINENCKFDDIGESDQLMYSCGDTSFEVSSEDGNYSIIAYPDMEKMQNSPEWKELIEGEVE